MAVTVMVKFEPKAGLEDKLQSMLQSLVEQSKQQAGCTRSVVHRPMGNTQEYIVLEEWSDQPTHAAYSEKLRVQGELDKWMSAVTTFPRWVYWEQLLYQ
jgi:quinol monooxygenase YgiN